MPTYVYAIINPDGSDGDRFEVFQRITDAALIAHPDTGAPVRRVPVASQFQAGSDAQRLSNSNLERLGFTKYERAGDGTYEKKAGEGPRTISADD
jgi:hypothetical protein